jgi:L,D-transpeptidase catalytic domain
MGLVAVATAFAEAPAASATSCHGGMATSAIVGHPVSAIAWRAGLLDRTRVYWTPRARARTEGTVAPAQASSLLVLGATRAPDGRCWVRVRLPTRPNNGGGWLHAEQVRLRPTAWSIAISRAKRTLTVLRAGRVARRWSVVIGAPATPTPTGLFSIIGAWRSPPDAFLGSWILPLTAHSDALQEFDGGDGTVGVHGRGGASLLDPLGSARSHGCIRLANSAIDWLVRSVGAAELAGTPVWVR